MQQVCSNLTACCLPSTKLASQHNGAANRQQHLRNVIVCQFRVYSSFHCPPKKSINAALKFILEDLLQTMLLEFENLMGATPQVCVPEFLSTTACSLHWPQTIKYLCQVNFFSPTFCVTASVHPSLLNPDVSLGSLIRGGRRRRFL